MKDREYMKLAIDLAKSASGQTSPNPMVGAVVVKNGQVVGVGAHLKAGEPHAEVHAIKMAGDKAKGADIYVTLEPCSHFGKTPPCADLIVQNELKRVVIATVDPNPQVAGKGIKKLRDAGIRVEEGLLKEEADEINRVFYHFIRHQTPFVTLKSAVSLDGKIATSSGESKWITSEESRLDVHELRHKHDAILVGVNTVMKDDPNLTTRLPNGGKNPIRIVLDNKLRIPIECNLITDQKAATWVVCGNEAPIEQEEYLISKGIKVIRLSTEKVEVEEMLKAIGQLKITSLLVEGGAEVNGSFMKSTFVNQIITYIAPKLIGGKSAPSSIGGEGFHFMSDVLELRIRSVDQIGSDVKIVAVPKIEND